MNHTGLRCTTLRLEIPSRICSNQWQPMIPPLFSVSSDPQLLKRTTFLRPESQTAAPTLSTFFSARHSHLAPSN